MKFYSTFNHPKGWRFIIRRDEGLGVFYLYLYQYEDTFEADSKHDGACESHQDDYVQDTLERAKEQAFRDFSVPLDSWKLVE